MNEYCFNLRKCLYMALGLAGITYSFCAPELGAQGTVTLVEPDPAEVPVSLAFVESGVADRVGLRGGVALQEAAAIQRTTAVAGLPAVAGRELARLEPASPTEDRGDFYLLTEAPPPDASSRRVSNYPLPWVEATTWHGDESGVEEALERDAFELKAWKLFEHRRSFEVPPDYVGKLPAPSPLEVGRPYETQLARKLKKFGRKMSYREIRRAVKRQWREQYRESNMSYSQYRERMVRIRNIGKDPEQFDELDADFNTDEVREGLFQTRYKDGERELPLLTVGPLTITDAGAFYFDLGRSDEEDKPVVLAKDEDEDKRRPFLASKDYRVDTRVKFNFRADRAMDENPMYAFTSYGFTVDVDILSDVLGREMVSAEFEFEVDDHSDVAAFFNIVVKSRK